MSLNVGASLGRWDLARLTDPIAIIVVLRDLSAGWTPVATNTRLIGLEGHQLWNRLLWLGIALGALAVTRLRFRFAHLTATTWWSARRDDGRRTPGRIGNVGSPAITVLRLTYIALACIMPLCICGTARLRSRVRLAVRLGLGLGFAVAAAPAVAHS